MESRLSIVRSRGFHLFLFWAIVIFVVAIDQATKAAAIEVLEDGGGVLVPGIMNLVHVENTGAAFSIGQGGNFLFAIVGLVFLVGAGILVWRERELPAGVVVSLALVAGGGLGNVIDRLMNGSVTDFLSTAFIKFPVFNIADVCVTVGVFCAIVGYWLWDRRQAKAQS